MEEWTQVNAVQLEEAPRLMRLLRITDYTIG